MGKYFGIKKQKKHFEPQDLGPSKPEVCFVQSPSLLRPKSQFASSKKQKNDFLFCIVLTYSYLCTQIDKS